MSEKLELAIHKQEFSAKLLSWSKYLFAAYFVGVSVFFIISFLNLSNQLNGTLEAIKKDNAALHEQTQNYVKCIAVTLLKSVAERTTVDFQNCVVNVDDKQSYIPKSDKQQNSVFSNSGLLVLVLEIIVNDNSKLSPAAAAPPDPDAALPIQPTSPADNSRVLTIIDGILNDVDKSPVGGTLNKLGL